jgi:hypothetical protein
MAFETLEDRRVLAAQIWMDQLDYAPGSTALISGSGYQAGETVHLEVTLADGTVQGTPDNPWDVVDGGAGDLDGVADGNFETTWYVEPNYATDQSLITTATGLSSGEVASFAFTDSPKVGSLTVAAQSPNPVTAGNAAAYTITVNRGSGSGSSGAFTATLSITTTLPSGATSSFSVNPVSFAAGDSIKTTTLTISTTGATPAGITSFTVKAATSATDFATNPGTLSVTSSNTAPTITSNGAEPTASMNAAENQTAVTTVVATDTETPSGLTYSITGGADAGKFTINPSSGALTFNSAPDFESPADAGGNNVYDVIVTVTDSGSLSDSQAISVTVTDVQYNATIVVTGYSVTYNGNSHTATGTATGVNSENLSAFLNLSSTTHTNAGTYTGDNWTFTANGDYNAANGTVNNSIDKADAIVSVSGYTGTYDAASHGASGSVTGVDAGGAALGSSLDLGLSFTNAPGGTASWTFEGGTNYNDQDGEVAIVIDKADAIVSVSGYTGTYDAASHGASGSVTGVDAGGAALGSSLDLGLSFTNAPGGTASWTFEGGTNYNDQDGEVAIVIDKRAITVTATGQNKVADGTTTATVTLASDVLTGDLVTLSYATANFSDPFVGTGKTVTVTGISISGDDAGNYDLQNTTTTTTADITPASNVAFTDVNGNLVVFGSNTITDTIRFTPVGNTGSIQVTINDVSYGTFGTAQGLTAGGKLISYGLDGDDDIQAAGSIDRTAIFFGGNGNDRMKGGAGNDILVGGEGDDTVLGGSGRDLMIGGNGADRLVGDAQDDILIAGKTAYDDHVTALCSIMAEWGRNDLTFGQRVQSLRDGANSYTGPRLNDGTITSDNYVDTLTGASGEDWFLYNEDGVGGVQDKVTDLSTSEKLWDLDLDFVTF